MISPETLRRYGLFAGVDPAQFKALAMLGEEIDLDAGEWVFEEGAAADAIYLLEGGTVELTVRLGSGEDAEVHTMHAGAFLGWAAMFPERVYTMGARAETEAALVRIDGPGLRELMDSDAALGYQIMTQLAAGISERLTDLRVRFVSIAG